MLLKTYPVISINHEILFYEILKQTIYFKKVFTYLVYRLLYVLHREPTLTLVQIDLMK